MYAVIEVGGRQCRVQKNSTITVDRLALPEGGGVQFDRVFLIGSSQGVHVGTPTVTDAVVRGRVVRHLRGPKIRGFKYKPKKRYRRRFGHRSEWTQVLIEGIEAGVAEELVEEEEENLAAGKVVSEEGEEAIEERKTDGA